MRAPASGAARQILEHRTCLWPCVGRWASGQEAGQPPKEGPTSLHPRPAAGGETGAPRAQRGTRLKATTERAFLVSLALQRSAPKRLVHPCRACGTGLPLQTKAASSGEEHSVLVVSPSHGRTQTLTR